MYLNMGENMVANGEHEKISIGRVLVSVSTPQSGSSNRLLSVIGREKMSLRCGWSVVKVMMTRVIVTYHCETVSTTLPRFGGASAMLNGRNGDG